MSKNYEEPPECPICGACYFVNICRGCGYEEGHSLEPTKSIKIKESKMSIDTNSNRIEEGIHKFKIVAYPQEVQAGQYTKYAFEFQAKSMDKPMKLSFFPNQMGSLCRAIGMTETQKGIFDGDIQDAYGMEVEAELFFEDYEKQDGTTGKARRLRNFVACEQSEEEQEEDVKPSDISWEE